MVYRVAGILNNGIHSLTVAFTEFEVSGKNWSFQIINNATYTLENEWQERLQNAHILSAKDYLQLHADYGTLLGRTIQQFIDTHELNYKIQLIASAGYEVFEQLPYSLGDGAAIAAITGINTVSNFFELNAALEGTNKKVLYNQLKLSPSDEHAELIYNSFFSVLRWREENNFLADGGAARNSIGGAVWIGQEW